MTITEPMTLATDYALAGVTAWLGWRLYKRAEGRESRQFWALAFAALALGAFLGGTWHGLLQSRLLWKATLFSVGAASFAMVAGSAFATLPGLARVLAFWLALGKLVVYGWWVWEHDEFIWVVVDTGIAFAIVAALHLWKLNRWIVAGVAVSVAAGVVQASGYDPHPHFNHNDLYHVIQIAAMFLLYGGVRRLTDY